MGKQEKLLVWTEGWIYYPIPDSCRKGKHQHLVRVCNGEGDFGYCADCGLRSPTKPHDDNAWAGSLLKQAQLDKTAFRDMKHLVLSHSINIDTREISHHFHYVEREVPTL